MNGYKLFEGNVSYANAIRQNKFLAPVAQDAWGPIALIKRYLEYRRFHQRILYLYDYDSYICRDESHNHFRTFDQL